MPSGTTTATGGEGMNRILTRPVCLGVSIDTEVPC
jgi:hypothetical protein